MKTHYITKSEEHITEDSYIIDDWKIEKSKIIVDNNIKIDYTIIPKEWEFYRHILLKWKNNFRWNGVIVENSNLTITAEAVWDNTSAMLDILAIATNNSKISVNWIAKVDKPYKKLNMRVDQTNILIGENSVVRGVPRLEIATNDIEWWHSCKIHRLGWDALFYLESHWLNTKNAEIMLLNSEILKRLETLPKETLEDKCSNIHKILFQKK